MNQQLYKTEKHKFGRYKLVNTQISFTPVHNPLKVDLFIKKMSFALVLEHISLC